MRWITTTTNGTKNKIPINIDKNKAVERSNFPELNMIYLFL